MAFGSAGATVLNKLFGQGGGGAESLDLASRRGARMDELERGIGQESGFKDPVSAASILRKGLYLRGLERDVQQDPMMGADAQQRVAGIEKENDAYGSYIDPENTQMRDEEYGRKFDLATAPARITADANVQAAGNKAQAMLEAQQIMRQIALESGRSVSMSGVGSLGAVPRPTRGVQIPAAVMNKYSAAKAAAEKQSSGPLAGVMKMFGMGGGQNEALGQARRNAFGYIVPAPALDLLDQAAPHFKPGMPLQQRLEIMSQMGDLELTPDEFEALQQAAMEW
jgi:hypothetical protein